MKDSLIFYITQYLAIKELTDEQLGRLFRAVFEKQLGNEVVLNDDIKIAFNFINNQLVVDNKKYEERVAKLTANAKKGGAPKGNKNAKKQLNNQNNQIESVNVNDNVNVNVNVNDNDAADNDSISDETIFKFFEQNFGTISPFILDTIVDYQKDLPNELILYALQLAVKANIKTMNYVEGILKSWISKNIKTLVEAKDERKDFKKPKEEKTEDGWDEFIRVMKERGET